MPDTAHNGTATCYVAYDHELHDHDRVTLFLLYQRRRQIFLYNMQKKKNMSYAEKNLISENCHNLLEDLGILDLAAAVPCMHVGQKVRAGVAYDRSPPGTGVGSSLRAFLLADSQFESSHVRKALSTERL